MTVKVKICGIQDSNALEAAIEGEASWIGFVFFPLSRNAIAPEQARILAERIPHHITRVGLIVDADDHLITHLLQTVPLDMLQLHGVETPERIQEIKSLVNLPIMKALRLKTPEHFNHIPPYEKVADYLLFDSRIGNETSGGPINWKMLKDRHFKKPWMLAGGLKVHNLREAVEQSGATAVDVSSGVEGADGHKCPEQIKEFLLTASKI